MHQTVACPHCTRPVTVAAQFAGMQLGCPHCAAAFVAPAAATPAPVAPAAEVLSLDDDESPTKAPPRTKPAKKKRPKSTDPFAFDADPDGDERPGRKYGRDRSSGGAAKGVALVVSIFVAIGVSFGVRYLVASLKTPDVIPDSAWQSVEVPGVLKAKLPGRPSTDTLDANGMKLVMKSFSPDSDSVYMVAYSQDEIPPARQALPADTLLKDACDGAKSAFQKFGGTEVSRDAITSGGHPGKSMVIDVPKAKGQLIFRVYYARNRIIMVAAGGSGMDAGHANAQKLFGSLEIVAPAAPPPEKKGKSKGM